MLLVCSSDRTAQATPTGLSGTACSSGTSCHLCAVRHRTSAPHSPVCCVAPHQCTTFTCVLCGTAPVHHIHLCAAWHRTSAPHSPVCCVAPHQCTTFTCVLCGSAPVHHIHLCAVRHRTSAPHSPVCCVAPHQCTTFTCVLCGTAPVHHIHLCAAWHRTSAPSPWCHSFACGHLSPPAAALCISLRACEGFCSCTHAFV